MDRPRMFAPPRPVSRTEVMQQRAEQRRREEVDITEMRKLLTELTGVEANDESMEVFSRALAEETGALPPPRIVVQAIKFAKSGDPRKVGDAVRLYYRKAKARAAAAPAGAVAPVAVAAPEAEETQSVPEPEAVGAGV